MDSQVVDVLAFFAANFVNLALAAMFVARTRGAARLEKILSLATLTMVAPVALVTYENVAAGRAWWRVAIPALLLAHLLVTLLLDHILRLPFRSSRWLGPYLLLFYAGVIGMIGYTFQIGNGYGFVTLVTYFLTLGTTWYSYTRVGHGRAVLG